MFLLFIVSIENLCLYFCFCFVYTLEGKKSDSQAADNSPLQKGGSKKWDHFECLHLKKYLLICIVFGIDRKKLVSK